MFILFVIKNKDELVVAYVPPQHSKNVTDPDAMTILSNWRLAHAYPLNKFYQSLKIRIKGVNLSGLVGQRLKRAPSIIEKLM